jgi:hypothetical protein
MDSLDRGGRVAHFYSSDLPDIKRLVESRVESLRASMEKLLNDFEKRMKIEMEIYSQ